MRRVLLTAAAAVLLAAAPTAHADGGPASDVLLTDDVFFPYAPNAPDAAMRTGLEETVGRARAKGYAVKLALIADERGIGSVGRLLSQPQPYADLLTRELGLSEHAPGLEGPRVLVVLPAGIGGNNLGDDAADALGDVLPEPVATGDGLARTAIEAIDRLARAEGKAISLPPVPRAGDEGDSGGGGIPTPLIFGAPVVVVALAAFVLSRRKYAGDDADDPAAPTT